MDQTVSVFIPVHNVADQLSERVEGLLEVMSETILAFDVWIIDDGSTDDTTQIAHDLARCYPQVTLLRHATRRGIEASIQTGLSRSTGDTVLVHTAHMPPAVREIRELLQMRDDVEKVAVEKVVVCDGPSSSGESSHWVDRLMGWGSQVAIAGSRRPVSMGRKDSSLRMIRRDRSRPIRAEKIGNRHDMAQGPKTQQPSMGSH